MDIPSSGNRTIFNRLESARMQHVATEFTSVSLKQHDLPRVILRASFASEVQSAMVKLSDCLPVAVVRGVTLHSLDAL
jgi:hypothetical protein